MLYIIIVVQFLFIIYQRYQFRKLSLIDLDKELKASQYKTFAEHEAECQANEKEGMENLKRFFGEPKIMIDE